MRSVVLVVVLTFLTFLTFLCPLLFSLLSSFDNDRGIYRLLLLLLLLLLPLVLLVIVLVVMTALVSLQIQVDVDVCLLSMIDWSVIVSFRLSFVCLFVALMIRRSTV